MSKNITKLQHTGFCNNQRFQQAKELLNREAEIDVLTLKGPFYIKDLPQSLEFVKVIFSYKHAYVMLK